jgi:predicted Fe-S protein YdhL (DUF1289 family)
LSPAERRAIIAQLPARLARNKPKRGQAKRRRIR